MDVTLIGAIGRSGQIGLKGELPWPRAKGDLARFRERTLWSVVIMGERTARAVGDLDKRVVAIYNGKDDPLAVLEYIRLCDTLPFWATGHGTRLPRVFVAGGAKTYTAFLPFVTRIELTRIDYDGPADTWMPPLWPINPHTLTQPSRK